jgi:hypothetical protein
MSTEHAANRRSRANDYYASLVSDIRDAIKTIGCIYPSIGQAMYEEPADRLAHKVAHLMRDKYGDSFSSGNECETFTTDYDQPLGCDSLIDPA